MWVVDHLADIESDFSVFHRVDDPLALAGPEFFRKAYRLGAYSGVMAVRIAAQKDRSRPAESRIASGERPKQVPLTELRAIHPDLIEMR
jgi:ribonuclease BN (tRNA processing enzyme)